MKRSPALPDVPTVTEAGVPGYEAANWIGLVATAGTPDADCGAAAQGDFRDSGLSRGAEAICRRGADVVRMSAAQFGAYMTGETDKWGRVVKQAGIKAQ